MDEGSGESGAMHDRASRQDVSGDVALRTGLALCGACAGLVFYLLIDEKVLSEIHPRAEQWVTLFALGMFPILGFGLGPLRFRRALPAAAIVAGIASAMAYWAGLRFQQSGANQGLFDEGELFVLPYMVLIALCIPPTIALCRNAAEWRDHAVLYDLAVRAGLKFLIALAFVGLFWAVFFLSDELLQIVDLSIWKVLRKHDVVATMLSFTCAGLAFAVAEEMPWVTEMLRGLMARLLTLLVPVIATVVVVFVLAVLVRGVDSVFDSLSAAGVMLGVAGVALLLVAFVLGRDDEIARFTRVTGWSVRLLLLVLPIVAAIAIYALWLRVGQYGWTPSRLLAVCIAGFITLWALAGAGIAVFGKGWPQWMRRMNVAALVSAIILILVWFSPILNAQRISVNSQVARLLNQETDPEKFDYWPLKQEWGYAGQAGLDRIRSETSHPQYAVIAAELKRLQTSKSRHQFGSKQPDNRAKTMLAAILADIPTRPAGRPLPDSAEVKIGQGDIWWLENLQKNCDAGRDGKPGEGCFAVFADLVLDREGEEILLVSNRDGADFGAFLFIRTAEGSWRKHGVNVLHTGNRAAALDRVRANTFTVETPSVKELVADGLRIVPVSQ